VTVPYSASSDAMKGGVGRKRGGSSTSIPNVSASTLLSSSCSALSRSVNITSELMLGVRGVSAAGCKGAHKRIVVRSSPSCSEP